MKLINRNEFELYCSNEKKNMNQLFNNVNKNMHGRVCLSDWLYYIMSLFKLVKDDVKVYAETGTLWGGSAAIILKLANADTELFCIDLFDGYYKKPIDPVTKLQINDDNHLDYVKQNLNKFNNNKNNINYLKGSSYDVKTVSTFKSYKKSIDFLFIDGDHSEHGVVSDFMMYKEFISSNGIICFDNYGGTAWPGVKTGLDKLNFVEQGFNKIGEFSGKDSGCLIIQRIK